MRRSPSGRARSRAEDGPRLGVAVPELLSGRGQPTFLHAESRDNRLAGTLGIADRHQKVSILQLTNQLELAKKFNPEQTPAADAKSLEKRIKELERLLEDEKIRSEMLSRMIDIAETEYKIPIKKKPITK